MEYVVATNTMVQLSQFKQLVGRVSRLATDVQDHGSISLVCTSITGTLEGFLQRHLQHS